eukprot:TRINITY_DN12560_c0_g1_i1.p1 TRINITY_DN12560_c0_g1~~TRINITY_DN12560_c0_g1_i1.p1  ORF type:complete len:368 (+),score=54.07 TRINITY_DN12560_c0_g1_i1:106-1209(+)
MAHKDWVSCLLSLSDGSLLSGSGDTKIKHWISSNGRLVHVFVGHTRLVVALVELDEHNQQFASCSLDSTLRIWSLHSGLCLRVLGGASSSTGPSLRMMTRLTATMNNDAISCLMTGDTHGKLELWNLQDDSKDSHVVWSAHNNHVSALCQLKSGLVVSSSYDSTIKIWKLSLPELLTRNKSANNNKSISEESERFLVRTIPTENLTWAWDVVEVNDRLIAGGMSNGLIIVWNSTDGTRVCWLEGHGTHVKKMVMLDVDVLCSISFDHTICVWNMASNSYVQTKFLIHQRVSAVAKLRSDVVAIGLADGSIEEWRLGFFSLVGLCCKALAEITTLDQLKDVLPYELYQLCLEATQMTSHKRLPILFSG